MINFIISGIIILIIGLIIRGNIRDRKNGAGCSGCANSSSCGAGKSQDCSSNNPN